MAYIVCLETVTHASDWVSYRHLLLSSCKLEKVFVCCVVKLRVVYSSNHLKVSVEFLHHCRAVIAELVLSAASTDLVFCTSLRP